MSRSHSRRTPALALLVALLAVALSGCGLRSSDDSSQPEGMTPAGTVLTHTEIVEMGARTAMEALERGRTHLTIARTREGTPVKIRQRGIGSLVLAPDILLVVDGSRVSHPVSMLQSIPAESIIYIQVLTAREAAVEWGSESGNGVIVVKTAAR